MLTIFGWNFEIEERCKGMHCVDLGESFPRIIFLQKSASIQPRTSPSKFGGNFKSFFIRLLNHQVRLQKRITMVERHFTQRLRAIFLSVERSSEADWKRTIAAWFRGADVDDSFVEVYCIPRIFFRFWGPVTGPVKKAAREVCGELPWQDALHAWGEASLFFFATQRVALGKGPATCHLVELWVQAFIFSRKRNSNFDVGISMNWYC